MGLGGLGRVAPGSSADLVVFSARSLYGLLARPTVSRRFIFEEKLSERAVPGFDELETWPRA